MLDLMERRREPRFDVSLTANIKTQQQAIIEGTVCNISRSGMKVLVANEYLPALMPNLSRDDKHFLALHIAITLPELAEPIFVHCRLVYFNRASRESVALGCGFECFEGGAAKALTSFIQNLERG
jgi:c-di-GMP-binding flagellar brake protein YcgR